MQKITLKDGIIIFLAVALLVVIIVLLTKSDGSQENLLLQMEREKQQIRLDSLQIENDKLNKEFLQVSNDAIEAYKIIDTLRDNLKNRKPIIKYIIKNIKDEEEKPLVVPGDGQLDSVFTSELRDR